MPLTVRNSLPVCRAMLLLMLLTAALAPVVRAQSVTNSASRPGVAVYGTPRVINVGILRLTSAGQNAAPTTYPASGPATGFQDQFRGAYLFYILNNRPDILPSIWTLKNPNAPTKVDATITSRFPTANNGTAYNQDAPVTQNMAAYWEINGDTITTTLGLSAYDLILITSSNVIGLNLEQRRALRQFVDKGGTLWIDTYSVGDSLAQANTVLDQSLIFHAKLDAAFPAGGTSTNDLSHPLATGYYTLSSSDLDSLGVGVANSHQILSYFNVGASPDTSLFHAVNMFGTGTSNFGSIAAANYGNGHILITDRAIADAINDPLATTTMSGTVTDYNEYGVSGTNFVNAPAADLKFVVNVLAWASNADGPGGGGRSDNAQPGALSGAIQSNWTFPVQPANPVVFNPVGTATYGNRMFVTTDRGILRAFDVNPGESLAYQPPGTALPDIATSGGDDYIDSMASDPITGVRFSEDYSKGYPYDEIWGSQVADAVSPPTVAEIPVLLQGATAPVNKAEVLVETLTGAVYGYDVVNGHQDITESGLAGYGIGVPIPAPTYYRGRIFATQSNGNIRVSYPGVAPSANTNPFTIPVQSVAGVSVLLSSPAIQSIPGADMNNFNGDDVVGYVYDQPGTATNNIYALFLGSRDEHLRYQSYNNAPTASNYETIQNSLQGLAGLSVFGAPEDTDDSFLGQDWLFTFPNANGLAVPTPQSTTAGSVTTGTVKNPNAPIDTYADYDLIPNTTALSLTRTTVNTAPMASTLASPIPAIQGIAVSSVSQGIAASLSNESTAFNTANNFYVTVNEGAQSAYIMSVKERSPGAKSFITWRFALVGNATDAEGVTYNFGGYKFVGAPVSDGNGYVYALATNGTSTRLMAFFANAICGFVAPFTATSVTQVDELNNTEQINPTQFPTNNTFVNFSASGSASLQPDLCVPLPLTISGPVQNGGASTTVTVPISTAQGAEPLLAWWVELPVSVPGVVTTNTPTVVPTSPLRKIGDTLYFTGQESSAAAAVGAPVNNALFAVYADPFGIGVQADPTTRQINSTDYRLVQVTPTTFGPAIPIPGGSSYLSPPPAGTGKYLVTASSAYTGAAGLVPGGIEGFGFVPTLVTDNHRLVEMDPSGNATWVVDSTRQSTVQAAAGTVTSTALKTIVPLNRPTSVTQFSTDDYLLADTGNNRVIHIGRIGDVLTEFPDKYGHTLLCQTAASVAAAKITPPGINPYALEITSFSDPAGLLAPGTPLSLNQPGNVTFWLTYDADPSVAGNVPQIITAHYLICDTGNRRIVEVDDIYTRDAANYPNLQIYDLAQTDDYHQLAWVTKTTENGHAYQYTAAQALFDSTLSNPLTDGPVAVAGAVANARVSATNDVTGLPGLDAVSGLPTVSALAPADQDSQGSAVLMFAYAPAGYTYIGTSGRQTAAHPFVGTQDGLPFVIVNSVLADGAPVLSPQPLQPSTLASYLGGGLPVSAATPYVGYALRGLRSMQIYNFTMGRPAAGATPAVPTSFGLLIADDDGVFDGSYNSYPANPGTTPMPLSGTALDAATADYGWSFRDNAAEHDYTSVVTQYDTLLDTKNDQPLSGAVSATDYVGTPFSPASAMRLANNSYLIVNRGGTGNPNGVPAFPATGETGEDFGGNVFVVRAKPDTNGLRTNGGTLSGVILGKPANTSALDGPSFALKSN